MKENTVSTSDYRAILSLIFSKRVQANRRYSLRAFARDIDLAPSRLSQVLKYKEGISGQTALKIATKLGLSSVEVERFRLMAELEDSRSKEQRRKSLLALKTLNDQFDDFKKVDEITYAKISEWYHYAILELISLDSFKGNPRYIAQRLGITQREAALAVKNLLTFGLIRREGETLVGTGQQVTVAANVFISASYLKLQKSVLKKAAKAIKGQPYGKRDISCLFVSINDENIDEYKKIIKEFRRTFNKFASKSSLCLKRPNEIYALGTQFFRISEK